MNTPKEGQGTRAAVPPPPRKQFLPADAKLKVVGASENMQDERLAPMTFNMPRDWHTRFKMTAASRGLSMKELLMLAFDAWESQQAK